MILNQIIQGNLNALRLRWNVLPDYIKEQADARAKECSDCFEAGKCSHCGCLSPQLFLVPSKQCKLGKWDRMKDEKAWNKIKETKEEVADTTEDNNIDTNKNNDNEQ